MRLLLATLALMFGLTTAHAQIAGQNDPQFKAALALWLEGEDDLAALTSLSELSKADNRAAQVFLGRVNEATHTHIHVTGPMERKARIALMRQVGGLSGKSWLIVASADTPLAAELLKANKVRERLGAIGPLLQLDENVTAFRVLRKVIDGVHGEDILQLIEVLESASMPPLARIFTTRLETQYALENQTMQIPEAIALFDSKHSEQDFFMWASYTWVDLVTGKVTDSEIDPYLVDNPAFCPSSTALHRILCERRTKMYARP